MNVRERGMTLIELMVAMSVLGLVAALVAFSGAGPRELDDDAQRRGDSLKMSALVTGSFVPDSIDHHDILYLPDGRIIRDQRP